MAQKYSLRDRLNARDEGKELTGTPTLRERLDMRESQGLSVDYFNDTVKSGLSAYEAATPYAQRYANKGYIDPKQYTSQRDNVASGAKNWQDTYGNLQKLGYDVSALKDVGSYYEQLTSYMDKMDMSRYEGVKDERDWFKKRYESEFLKPATPVMGEESLDTYQAPKERLPALDEIVQSAPSGRRMATSASAGASDVLGNGNKVIPIKPQERMNSFNPESYHDLFKQFGMPNATPQEALAKEKKRTYDLYNTVDGIKSVGLELDTKIAESQKRVSEADAAKDKLFNVQGTSQWSYKAPEASGAELSDIMQAPVQAKEELASLQAQREVSKIVEQMLTIRDKNDVYKKDPDFLARSRYKTDNGWLAKGDNASRIYDLVAGVFNTDDYNLEDVAVVTDILTKGYDQLTPDEKRIYLYKHNVEGAESAQAYLDELGEVLLFRRAGSKQEASVEYSKDHPFWASIGTVPAQLVNAAMFLPRAVHTLAGGSPYASVFDTQRQVDTTRGTVGEAMGKEWGWNVPLLNVPAGELVYGTIMSMADFVSAAGLSSAAGAQGLATYILGTSAGSSSLYNAALSGKSPVESVAQGLLSATVETLTEKISWDRLRTMRIVEKQALGKSIAGMVLSQIGAEGAEEGIADIANMAISVLMYGLDGSDYGDLMTQVKADALKNNEKISDSEAQTRALLRFVQNTGASILGGMMSGGILSGANVAINYKGFKSQNEMLGAAYDLLQEDKMKQYGGAQMAPADTEVSMPARVIPKAPLPKIAGVQGELADFVENNLPATSAARIALRANIKKLTDGKMGNKEAAQIAIDAIREFNGTLKDGGDRAVQLSDQLGDIANRLFVGFTKRFTAKTIKETAEKIALSPEAAEQLKTDFDASKLDEATFSDAYTRAYQAGLEGIDPAYLTSSTAVAKLSPDLAKIAYDLGTKNFASEMRGQKMEAAAAAKLTKLKPGEGGVTYHASVDKAKLRPYQQNQINIWDTVAKVLGLNAVMFQSATDAEGNIIAGAEFGMENGKYEYSTGRIWIDVNAQKKNVKDSVQAIILKTAGHEIMHFIKHLSPDLYREYSRAVTQALANAGQDLDLLIDEQIARSAKGSAGEIDFGVALEEVIANQSDLMLRDSKVIAGIRESNPTLFTTIRDWITDFSKRVQDAFDRFRGTESATQKAIMKDVEGVLRYTDELRAAWDAALADATGIAPVAPSEVKPDAPAAARVVTTTVQKTVKAALTYEQARAEYETIKDDITAAIKANDYDRLGTLNDASDVAYEQMQTAQTNELLTAIAQSDDAALEKRLAEAKDWLNNKYDLFTALEEQKDGQGGRLSPSDSKIWQSTMDAINKYEKEIPLIESEIARRKGSTQAAAQSEIVPAGAELGAAADVVPQNGSKGRMFTNDNTEIDFHYALVPAGSVIASNTTDFAENPAYPQDMQPRERTDRDTYKWQIEGIAKKLNPARLGASPEVNSGAPVVGADMLVENGNGRTIAIQAVMEKNGKKAAEYREWLKQNAASFGLDPANVGQDTMLVRVNDSSLDRNAFAEKGNESVGAAYSAAETAKIDARKVTPAMLRKFDPSKDYDSVANGAFAREFVAAVMPEADINAAIGADNRLSQNGVDRLRNALFQLAYGDSKMTARLSEATEGTIKNIVNAMVNVAPRIALTDENIKTGQLHGSSIAKPLVEAYTTAKSVQANEQPIEVYVNQTSMVPKESPEAFALLEMFAANKRSGRAITAAIESILDRVEQYGDPNQVQMPGLETAAPSTLSIIREGIADAKAKEDAGVRFQERDNSGVLITDKYSSLNPNQDISKLDGVPAVRLIDGSVIPATGAPTHVSFIKNNKIDAADIDSGGWITKGLYEPSFRSETSPYIQRELAKRRLTRYQERDAQYLAAVNSGDMDTAQKMVDEAAKAAGYTVRAYHGTKNSFTVFDREKIGNETDPGWFGAGFYFHVDKDTASVYSGFNGRVVDAYLKLNKTWDINKLIEAEGKTISSVIDDVIGKDPYPSLGHRDPRSEQETARLITKYLENNGYDSVRVWGQVMVMNPEQIKSADPVTYDDSGNPIPLSHRFTDSADIRYQERDPVPPMYSKMERAIEDVFRNKSISKVDWRSLYPYLKKNGVTADEMRWSGISTIFKIDNPKTMFDVKSFTKAELLEFARGNALNIKDVGNERISSLTISDDAYRITLDGEDGRLMLIEPQDDGTWYDRIGMASYDTRDDAYWAARDVVDNSAEEIGTKFEKYALPGGTNYREVLFTVPDLDGSFQSAHWDEENVLAHTRLQDFQTTDGKPVLFIEEVQSDWHEKGREEGYAKPVNVVIGEYKSQGKEGYPDIARVHDDNENLIGYIMPMHGKYIADAGNGQRIGAYETEKQALDALAENEKYRFSEVPEAPFTTTWHEYVLKRALRMAAEGGYDYMAWTTGAMQADRYWGNAVISDAVDRFVEVTKPESIRVLADDIFGSKMAGLMPLNVMDGGMLTAAHNNKVRDVIISSLPVDVVDILSTVQLSAKDIFSNKNVVFDNLSVDSRTRVASAVLSTLRNTGATIRTKLENLRRGGGEILLFPTLKASDLNSREVAGLLSPSIYHFDAGSFPKEGTSTGTTTKTLPRQERGSFGENLGATKLAELLNAHASIIHDNEGLVKHGFEAPQGEGMKNFYDIGGKSSQNIPRFLNKYGAQWGAGISTIEIQGDKTYSVPAIEINERMKESVLYEGQVLYSERDSVLYEDQNMYSEREVDSAILRFLNNQKTVTVYRAMQIIDGKLYPPMAAKIKADDGKKSLVSASEIGAWEQAKERPELIRDGGKFELDKANGSTIQARYNPYFHTSKSPLNDQFSSAYKRDNLVIVEGEVPTSELTSGYRAQYAKDSVGEMKWHSGPVSSKLRGEKSRSVILSRWFKPNRIVSDTEAAAKIASMLAGEDIEIPYNVVTSSLAAELRKQGVRITETEANSRFQERTDDPSSAREILSTGFEAIAANDAERSLLKTYQGRVKELNAMEQAVTDYRTQIQAIESSIGFDPKAPNDRLIRLKNNVKTLTDKINRADKKLLTFEKAAPLKNVLDREVKKVQEKQAQIRRVQLEQYRNNRATTDSKRKLRDQIIRGVKKLNDLLVNESDKRHIPEGLKSVVIEFMQPFLQDTSVFYRDQLNRLRDVYDAIGRGEHEGEADLQRFFDEELAADLRDMALTLDGRRLSQLTEAELQTVLNIVGNLDHMIIYENAVEIAGRREEISTLSEAVKDEHRGKAKDKRVALLTGNNPVAMIVKMLSSQNIKPVYFFKTLGGTMKRLFDDIRRSGQSRYGLTLKTSRDYFIDIATKRHYWDWNNKKNDTLKFKTAIGDEIELTREQALSLYAISKREKTNIQQKASHLKEGGFVFTDAVQVTEYHKGIPVKYTVNAADTHPLNETDVEQVNAWLTDEQRGFADDMVAYLSTEMADLGNEASMKLYGIRKYLEKYYFPYKSSENFLYRQQGQGAVEGMQNTLKHRGFTKRTVQFANNPIVLDDFTKVWGGHVESMVMYNSMVIPLENFNRVYNYKTRSDIAQGIKPESVKSVLEAAYGRKAKEYIEQLIDDLNGGVRPPKAEALTDKMIGLFKRGAVFANLSVVVQQPSAIMRAMALIDPKHFLSAFYTKADNAEMLKYSGVAVLKEMGRFDVGLGMGSAEWLTRQDRKQMNVAQAMADKDVRDDTLAYLPRRADEITWTSIWRAVKNEVAGEGKLQRGTPEFMAAVTERFEDVIDYTQVYDSVLARSEMMRAKSGMMKSITAFMSEPTTSYNMLYDAFANRKDKGAKDHVAPARAMAAFAASIILNSLLKALVMAMRDDDEDKTYVEKYINSAAEGIIDGMNPVGMVPIFRDILSIVQGYDVNRADMALITDLYRALDKANSDRYTAMDKIEGIAGAVAAFLGVPVKNVWRDGKGIYGLITSKMPISATTGAGVKNALMEALPGYNTSLNAYYRRLYDAINDGDMNKQAELTEILMRKGKEQKTIDAGLRKLAREAALEGAITPSTAMEQLKRFGVDSVTTDVRDLYDANVITQDEAVRLLEQYGAEKMDAPDERYKIITRWNHERTVPEGEDSDYKVMDNFLEAVKTGKNLRNVVTDYMDPKKYGYDKSDLSGEITKAFKPKYIALMKTDRKAAASLQGYLLNAYVMLGYDRDDRKKAIDKWLKP